MEDGPPSEDDGAPSDTELAIMEATQRAFATHGYADLSMAKIADEFDGSQSLLHYHYDTKEGLVVAFLRYARTYYDRALDAEGTPGERLERVVDVLLFRDGTLADERLATSFVELHGRAHDSEPIRRELAGIDELFRRRVAGAVADGIEAGEFAAVDPDAVARMVVAAHDSAALVLALGDDPRPLHEALSSFVLQEVRG